MKVTVLAGEYFFKKGRVEILRQEWLQESSVSGPYDDEETRSFYATLTDVKSLVPAVLLGKGQEREEDSHATTPAEPSSPLGGAAEGGADALGDALALEDGTTTGISPLPPSRTHPLSVCLPMYACLES